jgi:hypothetical protein
MREMARLMHTRFGHLTTSGVFFPGVICPSRRAPGRFEGMEEWNRPASPADIRNLSLCRYPPPHRR